MRYWDSPESHTLRSKEIKLFSSGEIEINKGKNINNDKNEKRGRSDINFSRKSNLQIFIALIPL